MIQWEQSDQDSYWLQHNSATKHEQKTKQMAFVVNGSIKIYPKIADKTAEDNTFLNIVCVVCDWVRVCVRMRTRRGCGGVSEPQSHRACNCDAPALQLILFATDLQHLQPIAT